MKLVITTIREFPDEFYGEWVKAMHAIGSVITDDQFRELYETGKLVIPPMDPLDKAVTVYKIIERDRDRPSLN